MGRNIRDTFLRSNCILTVWALTFLIQKLVPNQTEWPHKVSSGKSTGTCWCFSMTYSIFRVELWPYPGRK